jgi:Bacterial lipid A biosynthesis acyltransferase
MQGPAFLSDLAARFLWPALVALLPRKAGKRVAFWVADHTNAYLAEAKSSLESAKQFLSISDEQTWMRDQRFVRLIDDVDLFSSLIHSADWFRTHARIDGAWPAGGFIAVTFHWGNGLWVPRMLHDAGRPLTGLTADLRREHYANAPVRYWYAALRNREVRRVTGGALHYVGDSIRALVAALRREKPVCVLFDVPVMAGWKFNRTILFGRAVAFPRGIARLAVKEKKPVVLFLSCVDPDTGEQSIAIDAPVLFADEQSLTDHLARRLEAAIRSRSYAWHHWPLFSQFEARDVSSYPSAAQPGAETPAAVSAAQAASL